jgi:hypothetical protein
MLPCWTPVKNWASISQNLNGPFFKLLVVFSSVSFLIYVFGCLFTCCMRQVFERLSLNKLRFLTGLLEVAAAIGLTLGLVLPIYGYLAAGGLAAILIMAAHSRINLNLPTKTNQHRIASFEAPLLLQGPVRAPRH